MLHRILAITATIVTFIGSTAQPQSPKPDIDIHGDPLSKGVVARLGTVRYRHEGWYKQVVFLPDNKSFAIGTKDNTVRVWNAATGKMRYASPLLGKRMHGFAVSDDGRRIATLVATYDPAVQEYTTFLRTEFVMSPAPKMVAFKKETPRDQTTKVAFMRDDNLLVTGDRQGNVQIWDIAAGDVRVSREMGEGEIKSLDVSPDGTLIAAASNRGVSLWHWKTPNAPIQLGDLRRGAQVVRFSPDGQLLAIGVRDEFAARIWDVKTEQWTKKLRGAGESYYREGLCFAYGGTQLVVPSSQKQEVEFFDLESGKLVRTIDAAGMKPRGVAVSGDGKYLAVIGSVAAIGVWDLTSGARISDRFPGHHERPYELVYHPDTHRVVSGSLDGTIRVWDADSGKQLAMMKHDYWVSAMAISPDGRHVLSCGFDETVRLWDLETQKKMYEVKGHGRTGGNHNFDVAFAPDGERIMTFGTDLNLQIRDRKTGDLLLTHAIRPKGLALKTNPDGKVDLADEDAFGGPGGLSMILEEAKLTQDGQLLLRIEGKIQVFDVETGKEDEPFQFDQRVDDFCLAADGTRLATLERQPSESQVQDALPQFILNIREYSTRSIMRTIKLEPGYASDLVFSSDGQWLAYKFYTNAWNTQREIRVLDAATGNPYAVREYSDRTFAPLAFSPEGSHLAVGCDNSSVEIWDLAHFRIEETK